MPFLKLLMIFLIMLNVVNSATVTTYTCSNATTVLANTTYDNGTQVLKYEPCVYSCENGICLDFTQQLNYLWVLITVIIILVAVCCFLMFRIQHYFFRTMVFFFGLLLLVILFLIVGGIGNSIGEQVSKILIYIGYVIGIILVFLISVFAVGWIRDIYGKKNDELYD